VTYFHFQTVFVISLFQVLIITWDSQFLGNAANFSQLTGYLSLFFLVTCSPFYFMSSSNSVHSRPPSSVGVGTTSHWLGCCTVVAEGRGFVHSLPVLLQGSQSLLIA